MEGVTSPSMMQSGAKSSVLSPLLISMVGIVVTTMAILAYHLLLVKYCARRSAANAAAAAAAARPADAEARLPSGVDEKVLAAIPILAFAAAKRGTDQEECVVCLGELEEGDAVRLLPSCKHAFHVPCIDKWFAAHASCPMCRSPVLPQITDAAPAPPDLAVDLNRSGSIENNIVASGGGVPPPPRRQSSGLLRHCASLVTPRPPPMEQRAWSGLKRSLSMDQTLVVIELQRANCSSATPFPSSSSSRGTLRRSGSFSTRSLSRFFQVAQVLFVVACGKGFKRPNSALLINSLILLK